MQKFIRLNVVLIPPKEVSKAAISLSKKLGEKYKTEFVLDGINFHPHITLYSPEYPERNLEKVLENVRKISQKTLKIKPVFDSVKSKQGYISIHFRLSDGIKNLHEKVVESLNPIREGKIRDKYLSDYKMKFTEQQIENVQKYGYLSAMNLYHPHSTIVRLVDENVAKHVSEKLKWKIKEFTANKIGVYTMGEHGTCRKLLKSFDLR